MRLLKLMCVVDTVIKNLLLWLTLLLPLLFLQQFLCLNDGLLILSHIYRRHFMVTCLRMAQKGHVHALISDLTHKRVTFSWILSLLIILPVASSMTAKIYIDVIGLLGYRLKHILCRFFLIPAGFTDGLLFVNKKDFPRRTSIIKQISVP